MVEQGLVVVAHSWDKTAHALVERWAACNAILMTPGDLSIRGWRYRVGEVGTSECIAAGRALNVRDIRGVLTRLPCVFEHDVQHMIPADRAYVAAEMHAFLLAWLSELSCPVLNRPTASCLAGPLWRREQWVHIAASLGIPVLSSLRRSSISPEPSLTVEPAQESTTVVVVGQWHFGAVDAALVQQAHCLAKAAKADLLAVSFSSPNAGARFTNAIPWPDDVSDDIADGIRDYLQRGDARRW